MPDIPATYEELRKARCEWCAKGYELNEVYGRPDLPCHITDNGDIPCTAPTPEAAYAELAAQMADRERKVEAVIAAYRRYIPHTEDRQHVTLVALLNALAALDAEGR